MRRTGNRRTTGAVLLSALIVAACGSNGVTSGTAIANTGSTARPSTQPSTQPSTPDSTTTTSVTGADQFGWTARTADPNLEDGTLAVPIDDADPSAGNFTLHLVRHAALKPRQRIGTLLVNPGGPGFGGAVLAEQAESIYGRPLLDRFDIVGWDPRGTGLTSPAIDCFTDYDHFFDSTDITPDTPEEKQQIVDLAKELAGDCVSKNAKILDHVATNDSARDMDRIRRALGEEKISYFGFSYGSELGATWATLFPSTVRAAVLDGAADPNADMADDSVQQAAGFEASLAAFLKRCSANRKCVFHNGGTAEQAFDELMTKIDDNPLPTSNGRPPLTRGAALIGVAQAMYSDSRWPVLEQALADAQQGSGDGLLALYDDYLVRRPDGSYDNAIEAYDVIFCMDRAERPTIEEDDATAVQRARVAPRLDPGLTGSYQCTFFPQSSEPRVPITGKGAGPIVVVGTTGDPATPLQSTRNMATTLEDGRLVVVTADQHTGYGVNKCSREEVDDYLVDPRANAPTGETRC